MVQQLGIHPIVQSNIFDGIHASIPLIGMILSIPFILTVQWFKQRSEIAALDKEKSETELVLLKQQINPHFFFNTLNNLYALSIKKDEATPEVILKLSELMRYVIYRGKEQQVKLEEEIKYLKDYISLQKIRLHKQLDFQFEQEVKDDQISISPLLFIILVENAFKHGIEVAEHEAFLHLYLKSHNKQLVFCCMNSIEGSSTHTPGIGLSNLRRRLDLLYPNRHHLSLEHNDFTFKATLEIQLP
jgi:LytS/YehU family sensor histidine kinase